MAAKKTPTTNEKRLVYVGEDPTVNPLFYVNNIEVSVSVFDIQIRLNRITEVKGSEVKVVNHGTVAMSPQHAKSLLAVLAANMKLYEAEYGEVPSGMAVD